MINNTGGASAGGAIPQGSFPAQGNGDSQDQIAKIISMTGGQGLGRNQRGSNMLDEYLATQGMGGPRGAGQPPIGSGGSQPGPMVIPSAPTGK